LALGDDAFEAAIFERMVLGAHREPLLCGIETGPSRHGPALEHAVMLQAEVEMGAPCRVFLDDEAVALLARTFRTRLGRLGEVPFRLVRGKGVVASRAHHLLSRFPLRGSCGLLCRAR